MNKFEFINNRVFDDRYSAFSPQGPQTLPGGDMFNPLFVDTGVKVHENGDVDFGLYAPNAKKVSVVFGVRANQPLDMSKDADGVWRATLKYDTDFCGPKAFYFDVDGAPVLSQYCPQYYSHGAVIHYVDIPDENTPFILLRDVPHGTVSYEIYWSDYLETWQRCLVYTPPGYEKGGEYPVLYLQHGGGENETSWVFNGRASHIMDNLIADWKAVPFVVVMSDGGVRGKDEDRMSYGIAFERTLIDNCIPFIEGKYRVKRDKWNRAIAGFSMGSMQSSIIGLSNPDKFAYIGLLSGFMRRRPRPIRTHLERQIRISILWRTRSAFYRSISFTTGVSAQQTFTSMHSIPTTKCAQKEDMTNIQMWCAKRSKVIPMTGLS